MRRTPGWKTTAAAVALLVLAAPVAAVLPEDTSVLTSAPWHVWRTETVDTSFVGAAGSSTNLVLDAEGRPHIVYTAGWSANDPTGTAWYARHDGVLWHLQRFERKSIGYGLALAPDGTAHVLYKSLEPATHQELRHAVVTPSGVEFETLSQDLLIWRSGIAVDASGRVHVYYLTDSGGPATVVYGSNAGSGWSFESLPVRAWGGSASSMVVTSSGEAHLAYAKHGSTDSFAYARRSVGGTWSSEVVSFCAADVSLAVDSQGRPHVSCHADDGLVYVRHDGSAWVREVLPGYSLFTFRNSADRGLETSIALDSYDRPHITYIDGIYVPSPNDPRAPVHLKYSAKTADGWVHEEVDRVGNGNGFSSDIEIDAHDRPRISYIMGYWQSMVWLPCIQPGCAQIENNNLMYAEPASTALQVLDD